MPSVCLILSIIISVVVEFRVDTYTKRDTLSKAIAVIYRHKWCSRLMEQIRGYYRPSPLLKKIELYSFSEPVDIEYIWTRISLPMKRYGYGWIYPTVTTKVAVALLVLHATVILVHCCVLVYTGISYSFAGSIGELMALTLNSKPPAMLEAASAEVSNGSTWARSTAVREVCGNGNHADRF